MFQDQKLQINTYLCVSGPKTVLTIIYIFQDQICKLIITYIFQDQGLLINTNVYVSELYFQLIILSIFQDQRIIEYISVHKDINSLNANMI